MGNPVLAIERMLAGLVEGLVDRWSPARMQPARLAPRLEQAMDEGALTGMHGRIAPDDFTVRLDRRTFERLAGARGEVERDLARHLERYALEQGMRTPEGPRVRLEAAPSLAPGSVDVRAAFRPAEPAPRAAEQTIAMPAAGPDLPPRAWIEIVIGDEARRVPIHGAQCRIGRAPDNDLVIDDTTVSRHHAVLRRAGEDFLLMDAGSSNGVRLNGRVVDVAALDDGDAFLLGGTSLTFRRR